MLRLIQSSILNADRFFFQALCGTRVDVPTLLSSERMTLNLSEEMIRPTTTKRIAGKGLPTPKDPSRRGDLIVHFDIAFPEAR